MEPSVTSHDIKIIYFQLQPDCVHIEEMPQFTIKKFINIAGSSSFVTIHKLSFQLDPTTRLFLTFMDDDDRE